MEAAATASVIQSSIAAFRPSNSISRSGILASKGPNFLPLGTKFHSIKVLVFFLGGFSTLFLGFVVNTIA